MKPIGAGVPPLLTVRIKLLLVVDDPSLTVSVIVAVPNWLAAGVSVTVRFAPVPPKTMFAFGTSVRSDEPPPTVRFVAGVSASPTVKPMVLEGVSSLVTWTGMLVIVGALLVALTVN